MIWLALGLVVVMLICIIPTVMDGRERPGRIWFGLAAGYVGLAIVLVQLPKEIF